jgi:putative FmdB family regulatory protein
VPIYEYACRECDHVLDALQKMDDDPLVHCPACDKPALKKLLSAPRFRLKGKGWYETDFKKDNQRNVLKSDTEPTKSDKIESKTEKSDAKKTEKKSDAKPSTKADSQ